ncbi:hypothetical protein SAMN04489729_4621 [Amycolatopsis lurida]|nr:hypothetical protein SAMN04489729_4621 [Amycolatopsis lurida]
MDANIGSAGCILRNTGSATSSPRVPARTQGVCARRYTTMDMCSR